MDSWRIYEKRWHQRTILERYQAQYRFCRDFGLSGRLHAFLSALRVAIFR
jgi:hypothetical protein